MFAYADEGFGIKVNWEYQRGAATARSKAGGLQFKYGTHTSIQTNAQTHPIFTGKHQCMAIR